MKLSIHFLLLAFTIGSLLITQTAAADGFTTYDFSQHALPSGNSPSAGADSSNPSSETTNSPGFQTYDFSKLAEPYDPKVTEQRAPPVRRPGVSDIHCEYGWNVEQGRCNTAAEARGTAPPISHRNAISCGSAPVCAKFNAALSSCGCQLGAPRITFGQRGNSRSCHNSGAAIDVKNIICGGQQYNAYTARFKQWFQCMTPNNKPRRSGGVYSSTYVGHDLHAIFQEEHKRHSHGDTASHFDHAHFSITCNGGTSW